MIPVPCTPSLIAPVSAVFAANLYVALLPLLIAKASPPLVVIGHIMGLARSLVSGLPDVPILREHLGDVVGIRLSRLFEDDGNSRRLAWNIGDPHSLGVDARRLPSRPTDGPQ